MLEIKRVSNQRLATNNPHIGGKGRHKGILSILADTLLVAIYGSNCVCVSERRFCGEIWENWVSLPIPAAPPRSRLVTITDNGEMSSTVGVI